MLAFLKLIFVDLGQWVITKTFTFLSDFVTGLYNTWKTNQALKKNQAALAAAVKSGDINAEGKSGENSLNGSSGS